MGKIYMIMVDYGTSREGTCDPSETREDAKWHIAGGTYSAMGTPLSCLEIDREAGTCRDILPALLAEILDEEREEAGDFLDPLFEAAGLEPPRRPAWMTGRAA